MSRGTSLSHYKYEQCVRPRVPIGVPRSDLATHVVDISPAIGLVPVSNFSATVLTVLYTAAERKCKGQEKGTQWVKNFYRTVC